MPHYDFNKDLPVAKQTEKEVATLLSSVYKAQLLAVECTNKYDLLMSINGTNYSFEVKEDFTCERTGNVGLEFECRGKPSGIQTSEADFHVHKIHTKESGIIFVLHRTSRLRELIDKRLYFRIVNGGDKGSNSMNYLFKYNIFARTGKILPLDKTNLM
jgi:hypothetical protein